MLSERNNKYMKKVFTSQQKAAMALEAIKGELTTAQIATRYEAHPIQIGHWKKHALKNIQDLFSDKRKKENWDRERIMDELYKTIGQRDMEIEWLKKKLQPFGSQD